MFPILLILDYISKWENIMEVVILNKHLDIQIEMICQFIYTI
jgi:hypothetical protein